MVALSSETRIAVIGGGKMGEAIMGGWIASGEAPVDVLTRDNFIVADPGQARRAALTQRYGVTCVADASAIDRADIVLLSVKPQVMMGVLATVSVLPFASEALFVSIAAGLETKRLEAFLPPASSLVRVMPNLPLLVGAGTTAVCAGSNATGAVCTQVRDLFACLGKAYVVDESAMDAVGALSGSGPAYVAALIEHVRDAGVKQGLDADLAEALALQTVYGTARLIRETEQTPEEVRVAVCSPGGTTLAALAAMDASGIAAAYDAGVAAAVRRSEELGSC
ncbi:MAG: pyrroline-5-carboxylate reductase [Raoultibacter sp.]